MRCTDHLEMTKKKELLQEELLQNLILNMFITC